MFAGRALYAIPGFEPLKTRLRVRVYAVLRCFTLFLRSLRSFYAHNARNMREISMNGHNSGATAHAGIMPIHTQFISDNAQIVRCFPWTFRRAQPRIRPVWGLCVRMR